MGDRQVLPVQSMRTSMVADVTAGSPHSGLPAASQPVPSRSGDPFEQPTSAESRLAAATIAGYTLSRTVGLPAATDDVGNWTEALGLASLFVEGALVLLSVEMVLKGRT